MSRPASFAVLSAVLAASLALAVPAGASSPKPPFTPGLYTARTSQKTTFRFKIVSHTAKNNCGTKAGAHCFVALSDPDIYETCSDGTSADSDLFDIPNGNVSPLGWFSYHQNPEGDDPLIDFRIHAWGTKASGSFREKGPAGAGEALTCDSATVTFTARLI